jgi:hypothetical protein
MAITNYSELKTAVANWLDRSDLTAYVPDYITLAESKLRKDRQVRKIQVRVPFSVSTEKVDVPSDFRQIKSLYHDGPTYYGPIDIVGEGELAQEKHLNGADSGVPAKAAYVSDQIWFSPEPDATYSLVMTYETSLVALSDSNTTNWLITNHPEIYLYAALVESAPFLKDDARIATWETMLSKALGLLYQNTQRQEFSGHMVSRPRRPIGG